MKVDLLKEYIKLKQQEKEIKQKLKQLQELLLQEDFEKEEVDNFVIQKVKRFKPKLKAGVDILEIQDKYPELIKVDVDVKKAVEKGLDDIVDLEEVIYLVVKESKK